MKIDLKDLDKMKELGSKLHSGIKGKEYISTLKEYGKIKLKVCPILKERIQELSKELSYLKSFC